MESLYGAFLGLIGIVLGLLIQEIRFRRAKPREDANEDLNYQKVVIDALKDANINILEVTKTNSELSKTVTEQAATIGVHVKTIENLITKLDGLPKMIAEQTARELVLKAYSKSQSDALTEAGVPEDLQPVKPKEIPLSKLVPIELLELLNKEKKDGSRNSEDTQ